MQNRNVELSSPLKTRKDFPAKETKPTIRARSGGSKQGTQSHTTGDEPKPTSIQSSKNSKNNKVPPKLSPNCKKLANNNFLEKPLLDKHKTPSSSYKPLSKAAIFLSSNTKTYPTTNLTTSTLPVTRDKNTSSSSRPPYTASTSSNSNSKTASTLTASTKPCFLNKTQPSSSRTFSKAGICPSANSANKFNISTNPLTKVKTPCSSSRPVCKAATSPSETLKTKTSTSSNLRVSTKPLTQDKTPHQTSEPLSKAANPALVNSKTASSRTILKKHTTSVLDSTSKQPILHKPTPSLPPRLDESCTRKFLDQLTTKFKGISSSILRITDSKRPVKTKSLESLLSLEVSNSLGDSVNDPALAQVFVEATRRLLEELVELYEGGKLNPKLFREKRSFIRASSATTVCYRDRYFKELVMNVLQSMTSSDIEEEVTGKATKSDESKERIRVIRDMVRTEAGIEPDNFKQLEQRLEELRKALSKNKLEVNNATLEVDRMISQHTLEQNALQIPKPIREMLKVCCSKRLESGSDFREKGTCDSESDCDQTSFSKSKAEDGKEKYKDSLNTVGEDVSFENGNSDEIKNIRPQLKHLVHEELLRIKSKGEDILNHDREFDRVIGAEESPKSSLESVEYKSATSNCIDDDKADAGEEQTYNFLESFKAEISKDQTMHEDELNYSPEGCYIQVMDRIDEDEDETSYVKPLEITVSSASRENKESICFVNLTNIKSEIHELNKAMSFDINHFSTNDLEKLASEKALIERVRSNWGFKQTPDITNVLAELKAAFESLQVISDICETTKANKDYNSDTGDVNEVADLNTGGGIDFSGLSVGEISNVLMNVSVKIENLPKYLQESSLNRSSEQKMQEFNSLSVLEKLITHTDFIECEGVDALDEKYKSVKRFAKTFSLMSDSLKYSAKDIQDESISALNPPESLIETLHTLSRTEYFKDCFTCVKEDQDRQAGLLGKEESVLWHNTYKKPSNEEIMGQQNPNPDNNPSSEHMSIRSRSKEYIYNRETRRPEDVDNNIEKFEHFIGLTTSLMTLQDVSDMFLFLSTVLNDVPDRLKSKNVLDLDPPFSLLKALVILYHDDDIGPGIDVEKKKSFESLTIQNVADFLLYLSKTFNDIPERLKDSTVSDLNPPESLLRAITLLTSLSHFSIPESCSQEMDENLSILTQE